MKCTCTRCTCAVMYFDFVHVPQVHVATACVVLSLMDVYLEVIIILSSNTLA